MMTARRLIPAVIVGFLFGAGTGLTLADEFGIARSLFLGALAWIWVVFFCIGLFTLHPRSRPVTAFLLLKLFAVTGIPFGVYCFFLFLFLFGAKASLVLGAAGGAVMFLFAFLLALFVRHTVFPGDHRSSMLWWRNEKSVPGAIRFLGWIFLLGGGTAVVVGVGGLQEGRSLEDAYFGISGVYSLVTGITLLLRKEAGRQLLSGFFFLVALWSLILGASIVGASIGNMDWLVYVPSLVALVVAIAWARCLAHPKVKEYFTKNARSNLPTEKGPSLSSNAVAKS